MLTDSKDKNSFGIRFLRTGPAVLVRTINQLIAALDSLRIQPSADVDAQVLPNGQLVHIRTSPAERRSQTFLPWHVMDVSTASELRVAVYPGFVNGEAPVIDMSGTPTSILDDPAPYLVITATTSLWLKATVDAADDITAYEIIASASTPASSYTPGSGGVAHVRLASITVASGRITAVTQPVTNNVFLAVGDGYLWSL